MVYSQHHGIFDGVVAPVVTKAAAVELGEVACGHYRVSIRMENSHFVGSAFAAEPAADTTLSVRL